MFVIATATLMTLVGQVSGTPYRTGGDSPAGTDCSGLASWVANAATGRPIYGDRFHTGNEESALLARGFKPGTAPDALVIGWNSGHTAVTLPDGTPVSAGEGDGGVKVGGGGAFQPQFTRHMYLPVAPEQQDADPLAPPPRRGLPTCHPSMRSTSRCHHRRHPSCHPHPSRAGRLGPTLDIPEVVPSLGRIASWSTGPGGTPRGVRDLVVPDAGAPPEPEVVLARLEEMLRLVAKVAGDLQLP